MKPDHEATSKATPRSDPPMSTTVPRRRKTSKKLTIAAATTATVLLGLLSTSTVTAAEDNSDERLQPKLEETARQAEVLLRAVDEEFIRLADKSGFESTEVSAQTGVKVVKVTPTLDIPDSKMGVAQTVKMRFPVPVSRKAAVERNISVTGDRTGKRGRQQVLLPKGRWGWLDDQTAVYRTRNFWPGKTNVRFRLNLTDVVLRDDGEARYIGGSQATRVETLRLARSFVMLIKNRTHHMYVYQNGRLRKKFGVSLGKRNWETRSGIKVLTGIKYRNLRMTGNVRGETWDVMSPYSQPITTNGEFIHSAPWARYRIGKANGSHGCTNMNIEDARWLYHRTREGDPVVTKGTGRAMTARLAYGQGKHWTHQWRAWKKKSALPKNTNQSRKDTFARIR